jgi:hypothetical protein
MKMLLLSAAFVLMAVLPAHGEELQTNPTGFVVPLKELETKTEIEGVKVTTKSHATMTITMVGKALNANVDGTADLSDFQHKAGDIVRAGLNEDVECDHALTFSDATLIPYGCNAEGQCKSAQMSLQGNYEKKACLLGREKTVLNQSFTCTVLLTPEIVDNGIRFQSQVSDVSASGVMGKLMGLEVLRTKIVDMVNEQVKETAKSTESTMALTFPPELSPYKPRLDFVSFQSGEKGKLMMRVTGSATVPQEHAQEALEAFRQMVPAD